MKIIAAIQILIKLFTIGYGTGAVRTTERFTAPAAAGKRADTCGFYPLNSRFPLFPNPAQTRDRRPLRNRGTAEDFYFRIFLNLFAVSDTVLLHMWFHLRKRGMTVPRNSLTRYTARHLRIRRLVQFIFVGAVDHNSLTNCAALLCRACEDFPVCVAVRYL